MARTARIIAGLIAVAILTATFNWIASVNLTTAGFAYLITILLIAARWGLVEAVIASLAAAFCLNYFFLNPVGTLHIDKAEDWVALIAFLVTSLVASQLSDVARRRNSQLEQRQGEMERLYAHSRSLELEKARTQDLASRAEAARQSEQFKSTLLDAVAHEFKTPLTSIKAATSAILTSPSLTAEQRHELLTIIDQETERLSRLIREAIHLARAESGKLHLSRNLFFVEELVRETLKQSASSQDGKRIETNYAMSMPAVNVDAELFVLALKQLVDNAAKYSPENSPIRITVEASADSVWIRVHNQGAGLSERERTLVFERFYRSPSTSDKVPGTGIGLSIAQDIVKAHGGYLDVESGPGMGTEFSIRLPLAKGDRP